MWHYIFFFSTGKFLNYWMTRTVTTTAYSYTVCLVILWRYSFFFFFFFLLKMCEQPCAIPNCSGDKQDGLPGMHSAGVSLFALFWLLKKVVWVSFNIQVIFLSQKKRCPTSTPAVWPTVFFWYQFLICPDKISPTNLMHINKFNHLIWKYGGKTNSKVGEI